MSDAFHDWLLGNSLSLKDNLTSIVVSHVRDHTEQPLQHILLNSHVMISLRN